MWKVGFGNGLGNNHSEFNEAPQKLLQSRDKKGHTIILVPTAVPWSGRWVSESKAILSHLKSPTGHVTVCFIANPITLWGVFFDDQMKDLDIPWISLIPWRETFVRQYLEDQQLSMPLDLIRDATGYWPALLYLLTDKCSQVIDLERRASKAKNLLKECHEAEHLLEKFGGDVVTTLPVLRTLAEIGQPSESSDISVLAEVSIEFVDRIMVWGELLGITRREGSNFWRLDGIVAQILLTTRSSQ